VEMRLKAMHHFTEKLPLTKINKNITFPGKSTETCLQLGGFQSASKEVLGYFEQLLADFPKILLIHTGGMALDFGNKYKILTMNRY
jgi:type III pantothenate kinase